MANPTTYLLRAHPPKEPDTIVVTSSFRGAKDPFVSVPYVAGATAAPASYNEVDLKTEAGAVVIPLTEPATAGDRIAFKILTVAPLGTTVTAAGLSRTLTDTDNIIAFEYNGTTWTEM